MTEQVGHRGEDAGEHAVAACDRDRLVELDARDTVPGAGLTGIQDRIGTVGGRIEILTAPGRGTTVTGVVPWPPRTE